MSQSASLNDLRSSYYRNVPIIHSDSLPTDVVEKLVEAEKNAGYTGTAFIYTIGNHGLPIVDDFLREHGGYLNQDVFIVFER